MGIAGAFLILNCQAPTLFHISEEKCRGQPAFLPIPECGGLDPEGTLLSIEDFADDKVASSLWPSSNFVHKHEVEMFTVVTLPSTRLVLMTTLD